MKSKLLLGIAAFSLLLAVAVSVFWVRSYFYYDVYYYANLERSHQLFTVPGSMVFSTWNHRPADRFESTGDSGPVGKTAMKLYRDGEVRELMAWDNPPGMHGGFWWERGIFPLPESGGQVFYQSHANLALPFWVAILFFLLAPAAWSLKLWQRYRRARTGRCIYCNADMPTPDRCPNCGAEFDGWVM